MSNLFRWLLLVALAACAASGRAQTGTVSFSQSTYTVTNDISSVAITVNVAGSPDGNSSVAYTATGAVTSSGTLNFTTNLLTGSFNLNIPAGSPTNLLVNLALQNPTGFAVLGSLSNATLTIITERAPGLTGTHVFPITLSAFLTTVTNAEAVVKIKFSNRAVNPFDRLVLIIDSDEHTIALSSISTGGGDLIVASPIATSSHCAILPNGQFAANLSFDNVNLVNSSINIVGTGDVHIRGRVDVKADTGVAKLRPLALVGVFNDSVAGNTNHSDALIKGTINPAGKEYNIADITFE